MRTLRLVTTIEEDDLRLLSLANEKGKFAIPLTAALHESDQGALERAFDNDWVALIDVSAIAAMPGRLMRIFRLTDAGKQRLASLSPPPPQD